MALATTGAIVLSAILGAFGTFVVQRILDAKRRRRKRNGLRTALKQEIRAGHVKADTANLSAKHYLYPDERDTGAVEHPPLPVVRVFPTTLYENLSGDLWQLNEEEIQAVSLYYESINSYFDSGIHDTLADMESIEQREQWDVLTETEMTQALKTYQNLVKSIENFGDSAIEALEEGQEPHSTWIGLSAIANVI